MVDRLWLEDLPQGRVAGEKSGDGIGIENHRQSAGSTVSRLRE
jgi:hypothetical protein